MSSEAEKFARPAPAAVDTQGGERQSDQRLLACPRCATRLGRGNEQLTCLHCGKAWPIRDGIPRFFEPDYNWSESPHEVATGLLRAARRIGWREAVRAEFGDNPDRLISVLGWQRASWLAMLGLGREAVALDVGSGYGAITHALANAVGEVCSLEAIPERVEFTDTRLKQEGISNVCLVQATAVAPPFAENSFDLIVVNGILEWVGEWETEGNPREVQVRFLSKLRRLLKDSGTLLIGIENRFAYEFWRGACDHSGIPYTSLMPRLLASLCLRHSQRQHYRTGQKVKTEYRTYTYSRSGYRKLLAESGFERAEFYAAEPGYNQPFALVPLETALLREHLLSKLSDPERSSRSEWRRRARALWARSGLAAPFVSEFVILTTKLAKVCPSLNERVAAYLHVAAPLERIVAAPILVLRTSPFSNENTLGVFEEGERRPRFILKSSTVAAGSREVVETQAQRLKMARAHLPRQSSPPFSAPEPLGSFTVGNFFYTAESTPAGEPLSHLLSRQPRRQRLQYLSQVLPQCVEVATQLALKLRGETAVEQMEVLDAGWWELVPELSADGKLARLLNTEQPDAPAADSRGDWVQHGNFTIDNLFFEASNGSWTLVDWQDLRRGLPPLYDVFSLLLSAVPAAVLEEEAPSRAENPLEAQFLATFFGRGSWSKLFRHLILTACERLAIPSSCSREMFQQTLLLSLQNCLSRCDPAARDIARLVNPQIRRDAKFLQLASRHADEFLIPVR